MSTVKIDDTYINLPWVTGDPAKEEIRFDYEEMLSDDDGIVISSDDESVVLRPSVVDVKTEFENFDREKISLKKMEKYNQGSRSDELSEIDSATGIEQALEDLGKTPMPENEQSNTGIAERKRNANRRSSRKRAQEPVKKSTPKAARTFKHDGKECIVEDRRTFSNRVHYKMSIDGCPALYHSLDLLNQEELYEVQKFEASLRPATKRPAQLKGKEKNTRKRSQAPKSQQIMKLRKRTFEYEVEKIIAQKEIKGRKHFKVLWKNYPRSAASWEKEENLTNCPAKLQDFLKINNHK